MSYPNNKVAVLLPLVFRKCFDYSVPSGMDCGIGDYVEVPFGKNHVRGVVWGNAEGDIDEAKVKPVGRVIAHLPPMSEAMRKFIDWVAWYTLAPAGQVLKMVLSVPEALEATTISKWQLADRLRGHAEETKPTTPLEGVSVSEGGDLRSPPYTIKLTPARARIAAYLSDNIARTAKEIASHAKVSANIIREFAKAGGLKEVAEVETLAPPEPHFAHTPLSPAQDAAAKELRGKLAKGFSVSVLDGVTGSGKTEVYFDTIEACIQQNKQVLVMLPEIALSVQWLMRFEKRFGFAPDVWHSSVTKGKKRACWRKAAEGSAQVVVGARSALFLPFRSLGLIVVDEEHDASYKQEEGVIYQARDMAVARAHQEKIPITLVSATPSLETEYNIEHGRYAHVHLPDRHNEADLPDIKLVDMRKAKLTRNHWICEPLKEALAHTLAAKNQSMVFMNRRGYAPLMLCSACGHRFQCPNCTSWLVLHRTKGKLLCHHCGHIAPLPDRCPDCSAQNTIVPYGTGVERIAEELRKYFPHAKIAVMTSDYIVGGTLPPISLHEISPAGSSSKTPPRVHVADVITNMLSGDIDILVGTQMVAKGHHFGKLALVGVIDADMGLAGGDLRAGERTYQLLHQLSGRAGREKTKGTVYLQTYMPEHPVMQALAAGKRDHFMQLEAHMREDASMPPYGKLAAVIIEGKDERQVAEFARGLVRSAASTALARIRGGVLHDDPAGEVAQSATGGSVPPMILGPAPAPLARLKNKYRYRILVKAKRDFALQEWLAHWLLTQKIPSTLKLKVDIEPYSFV